MPRLMIVFFLVVLAGPLSSNANAACSWSTLANGTAADANQVMNNFDCLAPKASPTFTGNVGIGNSSPGAALSFENLWLSTAADGITWYSPGPTAYGIYKSAGSWSAPDYQQLHLTFQTGIVIDGGTGFGKSGTVLQPGGGTVGIGTAAPTEALHVNGRVKVSSLASASGTSLCINASVLASCSSSIRYKENVKDAEFGLDQINMMRPVTFTWKGRDESDFGLIAEEVAKIDPSFVTRKNGQIEGIKYPQLTAVLINAVKSLSADNKKLEEQVRNMRVQILTELRLVKAQMKADSVRSSNIRANR